VLGQRGPGRRLLTGGIGRAGTGLGARSGAGRHVLAEEARHCREQVEPGLRALREPVRPPRVCQHGEVLPVPDELVDERLEGRAYLPEEPGAAFGAFIEARRTTWAARPGDALRHDEATADGVLAPLAQGGFEIRRWAASKTAVHARTKTFRV